MTDDRKGQVVPFGKYKGRDIVEVLDSDPGYLQWLAGQDWFRSKYITLHQTIINRGAEPEETPDHNALQVLFLDDDFCLRFCRAHNGSFDDDARAAGMHPMGLRYLHGGSERDAVEAMLAKPITETKINFYRNFEVCGVDVELRPCFNSLDHSDRWVYLGFIYAIEIKPVVGDDYPAVLRQMKRNGSTVLFLERYTGQGATREQFIKTFKISEFAVVFLEDCK
jgi:hypothetical protein